MTIKNLMTGAQLHSKVTALDNEVGKLVVGLRMLRKLIINAQICNGHILMEDVPGAGKTTTAEAFCAALLRGAYVFFQGSADMQPSEISGSSMYDRKNDSFFWQWGLIKPLGQDNPTNILLADEINRNTPKTNGALLTAMQGRKLGDGVKREVVKLANPFLVIGTQNPIEQEGVYGLPEAVQDRFALKVRPGKLTDAQFIELLAKDAAYAADQTTKAGIEKVMTPEDIMAMQDFAHGLPVSTAVLIYIKNLVFSADPEREHNQAWMPAEFSECIQQGPGPRAGLWLTATAKANAAMRGSDRVEIEDVQEMAPYVLGHRLALQPHLKLGTKGLEGQLVKDLLKYVPTTDEIPVPSTKASALHEGDAEMVAALANPSQHRPWWKRLFGG